MKRRVITFVALLSQQALCNVQDVDLLASGLQQVIQAGIDTASKEKLNLIDIFPSSKKERASDDETLEQMPVGKQEQSEDSRKIHQAVLKGDKEQLAQLLQEGVGVDSKSRFGDTPLLVAVERGHADLVRLLLDAGADVNAGTSTTPLHSAISNGHKKIFDMLLADPKINLSKTNFYGDYPVHLASKQQDPHFVFGLINSPKNIPFRVQNKDGNTPVHIAAGNSNLGILELLLEKGAEIDIENLDFDTPLHIAVKNGLNKNVQALLNLGADIEATNLTNRTPLLIAVNQYSDIHFGKDYKASAWELLFNGANQNFKRVNDNTTPLSVARAKGYEDLALAMESLDQYYQELVKNPDSKIIKLDDVDRESYEGISRVNLFKMFAIKLLGGKDETLQSRVDALENTVDDATGHKYSSYKSELKRIFDLLSQDEVQELVRGYKPSVRNQRIVNILLDNGFIASPDDLDFKQKIQPAGFKGFGLKGMTFGFK